MNFFLGFFSFLIYLYSFSVVACSGAEPQKIPQELAVIVAKCSRFHLDMQALDRSVCMEEAGVLLEAALQLHKKTVLEIINFGSGFGQAGIDASRLYEVLPNFQKVQTNEKLHRYAIVYSAQRLVDAINNNLNFYPAPPLEKNLADALCSLKSSEKKLITAPYVEKALAAGKDLGLDKKIFLEDLLGPSVYSETSDVSKKNSVCCVLM